MTFKIESIVDKNNDNTDKIETTRISSYFKDGFLDISKAKKSQQGGDIFQ